MITKSVHFVHSKMLYIFYLLIILLYHFFYSFSEDEDQLIMKVDECDAIKNKFSVLSLILNRTRLQLYRRHEVLKDQQRECKSELNLININKYILR